MTPKRNLTAAALALALALPAGFALASDDVVLTDEMAQKIRTTLTEQGYEVAKIKTEDGLYEAYARKDGKKYEVFLDSKLQIVRTEED